MIIRHPRNPLITPDRVQPSRPDFEVLGAFNAGATRFENNLLLLVRVAERPLPRQGYVSTAVLNTDSGRIEPLYVKRDDPELRQSDPRIFTYRGEVYLTSISHLRVAVSRNGAAFDIAPQPTLMPETVYERYGIEDARITVLDGWFLVTYSAISPYGVVTALARTRDFRRFERQGILFGPDNKDVALFPEKIAGRYLALHRPAGKHLGVPSIWLASSENLLDWGRHAFLIGPRPGCWDAERVGAGAPPIRTERGWLMLYHGATPAVRYCTGLLLLDLDAPWNVIARSREPILSPDAPYERSGLVPNVVFHNGLVEENDGSVTLFYGAADDKVCSATASIDDLLHSLEGWT